MWACWRWARADLIAADTCLERSYRGNRTKLCSIEMARTRSGNKHKFCTGSFKLAVREKKCHQEVSCPEKKQSLHPWRFLTLS